MSMNHQRNATLQVQHENDYSRDEGSRSIITTSNIAENVNNKHAKSDPESVNILPPTFIFSPHSSRKNTTQDVMSTVGESDLPFLTNEASLLGKGDHAIDDEQPSSVMTDGQDFPGSDSVRKNVNAAEIDIKNSVSVKYHPCIRDGEKLSGVISSIGDKSDPAVVPGVKEEPHERVLTDSQSSKTRQCDDISLGTSSDGDRSKDDIPCCRICHGSSSSGQLLSPCYCKGTQGQVHINCLEQWLSCTGRTKCELCGYQFEFTEESKSFIEFVLCPGNQYVKNLLFCDILCFILVTPLTLASVCLVVATAALLDWKASMEVVGLMLFAFFVIFLYIFWLVTALRFQRNMWRHWKFRNRVVRVKVETSKAPNSSRNSSWKSFRSVERLRNDTDETVHNTFQNNQLSGSSDVQIWCSANSQILVIPRDPLES